MTTGMVSANGIKICYESFGAASDPALLLVMGLGVQMTEWEPEFCEEFVAHGFHVIRFDNRDVGLSTHLQNLDTDATPYVLSDMADDAVGLLDALGIERAHVVGVSMGGMIAQTIAIRHPERVMTLCSIMSTSGAHDVLAPTREALAVIAASSPSSRDAFVEAAVERGRVLRGGGFAFDEERARLRATRAFDRSFDPAGKDRQRAAVIASAGDRTGDLRRVKVPTVVVHGTDDPLVHVSGGRSVARAIPGAELILIPGLGHELPYPVWGRIAEAVAWNARRAAVVPEGRTNRDRDPAS